MARTADFLIIGGGIAGASAGFELSRHGSVIILERENQPGYHTTGRSAALYVASYGNATIRAITKASKPFFLDPPEGFTTAPILSPRGALMAATEDQVDALKALYEATSAIDPSIRLVDQDELLRLCPVLNPERMVMGQYEPENMDIDVHALLTGYLAGMRNRGGEVVSDAEVMSLTHTHDSWTVSTRAGEFSAPVVVNAAGAWADEVARLAGANPVGLIPKRRTAFTFDGPADVDLAQLPAVISADESWYFKPEAGRLLGSPADETPSPPCDAQPEELDIAIAVDRIQTHTVMEIKRLESKWAGLRSFVADKSTVAGFAPEAPGFFWVAGQGGYGIQTSEGMGRITASLATGNGIPDDIAALGVTERDLAPDPDGLVPG